ncbi:thioesterase-like superfamily-domain-containing protein [Multifurca ochricompacta]|uniref:Thioesterase-like superfamily-domain-containing protein n=1 Tax=Multifurca ochricompacta TaxID=376703 RepID=A0AAD4M444_9AGAM|nr:thioesterase-like superfamily-domain-containing protein [Multifurca ochricompacta]
MAPYSNAVEMRVVSFENDGATIYSGIADPEWTAGSVPMGGYLLGMVIEATNQLQSDTTHKDPLHVTAHFLRLVSTGPLEVHVRRVRSGKGFSNLTAELVQGSEIKVTSHLVALDALPSAALTRYPLPMAKMVHFSHHVTISRDISIGERHEKLTHTGNGSGGVEEGRWHELQPGERITPSFLPLICDVFPGLLPVAAYPLKRAWFATVTMSMEFMAPIPRGTRTIGVFGSGRFIENPQGRHDFYAEVWTAPANITDKDAELPENWREGQRCLGVSHQMALVIPFEGEHKKGKNGGKKSNL